MKEAMKLALEALENAREIFISVQELGIRNGASAKDVRLGETFIADRAIKALKEALAEDSSVTKQEQSVSVGEPVAWVNHDENKITRSTGWDGYGALYTTPPAQPAPVQPVGVEGGKRLIVVDQSFDELMYWLGRCEDKGHLENCPDLLEPWRSFQYDNYTPAAQPAPVPLTYEQITAISKQVAESGPEDSIDRFARAIEAAHGIKENT